MRISDVVLLIVHICVAHASQYDTPEWAPSGGYPKSNDAAVHKVRVYQLDWFFFPGRFA